MSVYSRTKMKFALVTVLALAAFASAEVQVEHTAYGYLKDIGIPTAEIRRQAEEEYLAKSRIVGGLPAALGQYPYQAGLLIDIIGLNGQGICGGSLISNTRVLTAAHCWFDGRNQAWRLTVVLGSVLLFSGGTRVQSSVTALHPNWSPSLVRNDVAVIYLPSAVATSGNIAPIALPTASQANELFVGESVIASGFGLTSDGGSISNSQLLSHVRLSVITNSVCSYAFPFIVQESNICTSGVGGVGTCSGDSGGPLVVTRNNQQVLIGVTSFGSAFGCQVNLPAVFARVTSFLPFLNEHL